MKSKKKGYFIGPKGAFFRGYNSIDYRPKVSAYEYCSDEKAVL
jgi:hypothetical protein